MAVRTAYFRRMRHWVANRGLGGFLREVAYRLKLRWQGKDLPGTQRSTAGPHPFDLAFGVDTAGLVWGEALEASVDKGSQFWATGYYGIAPSAFRAALDRLALDWPQFTFVDIGCGKGRALLLALDHPFRQVLGVELSPTLAEIANRNLRKFTAPWRIPEVPAQAIAADATTMSLPGGSLLIFLYHPFAGPVMKRFLSHMREAARTEKREIILLYANPELDTLLVSTPGVAPLWREYFTLSPEDSAADRFGSIGEYIFAYRLQA